MRATINLAILTFFAYVFIAVLGPSILALWSFWIMIVLSVLIVAITKEIESAYLIITFYLIFGFQFWGFGETLPGIKSFLVDKIYITWFFSTGVIAILTGLLTRSLAAIIFVCLIWTVVFYLTGGGVMPDFGLFDFDFGSSSGSNSGGSSGGGTDNGVTEDFLH